MRRGVSGDCGKEVGALEGVQVRVDPRSDGRRSRHISEQRDFAEVVGAIRGLVELDAVDGHVIGEYTERNPEDWSEFGLSP